ncbi:WD40/YVTN/BNR-like repeat-containing protein [Derxia lacustris]|uniref:WD40/YVTN/BNR-like repeat-containing protein n=1 Tax=Derxia lacustris TaxID=764842 RepID=UPI000A16E6CE|nr:YCF48-related protein [Derxia lacustris]
MNRILRLRPGRVALVLAAALVLASAAVVAASAPAADLLDRASQPRLHAESAVLISIARAGDRLVAAGERGTLLLSDDNGAHWRQAPMPVSVALTALAFPTPQAGWAVGHGGVILHSADGGEHWSRQLDGRQLGALERAAAEASGDARALADARRLADEGPDQPLLDVAFADAQRGIAVGAFGLALATADGGRSWQSIRARLPNRLGKHLYDVSFDGERVLIAGEQGALFRSTDGGAHFEAVATPYAGSFFGVLAGEGGALLLYGLRGTVLRSSDDGASWTRIDLGQPTTVSAGLRLADGSLLLADETGRVLLSQDGGASFAPRAIEQPFAFTGAVQAGDGSLVLSGVRGLARLASPVAKAQP